MDRFDDIETVDDDPPAGLPAAYLRLLLAVAANLLAVFYLSYCLIQSTAHFHANLNGLYLSLLITTAMAVLLLVTLGGPVGAFRNRALNVALIAVFGSVFAVTFSFARSQTFVDGEAALRSLIPQQSGTIAICEQARIEEPEIAELCESIVATQQRQIAHMEALLRQR